MNAIFNRLTTIGNKTGVGHYAANLFAALRENAAEHRIAGFPDGIPWRSLQARQAIHTLIKRFGGRTRLKNQRWWLEPLTRPIQVVGLLARMWGRQWIRNHIRNCIERGGFDLYHEPNFIPVETDVATVITVHDLSVLLHPEWHPRRRVEDHRKHFLRGVQKSRHIITVSDTVRDEVIRVLNLPASKVTRVYNGVDAQFQPLRAEQTAPVLKRLDLKPGYLLHVGTLEPRKNLLTLMRAYCALPRPVRDRAPLLLVGGWGWQYREIHDYFATQAQHRGVRHIGYVADHMLPSLYNGARALVCPSHYEGFGLPCMEMLACGGAVLASTADVFRETLDGQARLISANDTDAWRDAMAEIINNDELHRLLRQGARARAERFTWKNAALETLDVYQKAAANQSANPPMRRAA